MLALVLICVLLTIGAIWALPIWDDAFVWPLLKEKGAGMITAAATTGSIGNDRGKLSGWIQNL